MNLPRTTVHLEEELKSQLSCEVRFDLGTQAIYSTDASNYRHVPLGVVFPRTAEEIITAVRVCREHGVPILSRGGGTSLAGQSCNEAVMIETSKFYNRILELDPEKKIAVVQPGIVLDTLRNAANLHGLTFGPDPATHSRCTLGGMMGNNSCGVHAVMAGKTVDNVLELDVLTYDGIRMTVGPTTAEQFAKIMQEGGRKAEIYKSLHEIRQKHGKQIETRYPKIPRRVSGYNLDDLMPENHFDLAKALVGTEGTCVFILEAKLRLVPNPPKRGVVMIGFDDIFSAADACPALMHHRPIGLEAIDDVIVNNIKTKHVHQEEAQDLPDGNSWLLFEIGADHEAQLRPHALEVALTAGSLPGFKGVKIVIDEEEQKRMWEVREAGLGVTAYVPGKADTWEGWEDSAVDPKYLGKYLRDLKKLYQKYEYEGALYGHFGQACVHTRINFDLVTADGIAKYRRFIHEAANLVVHYGGSISGEHGDGQSKAELLPKMFGPELIQAFGEFKRTWDPLNKMNPGKIVDAHSPVQDLRLGTSYHPQAVKTHFQYPEDHGNFARAALRCVGVGACRKKDEGVMCPSYKVTHEEKDVTRGRARLLFEMLNGNLIEDGWNSEEVKESLDLCLACKACKKECPVNVDMATYKAEFLSHYYVKHWRPRVAYAMGQINRVAKLAGWVPWLANFFTQTRGFSDLAKKLAGIHPSRKIPKFASKTFRRLHGRSQSKISSPHLPDSRETVLLWVDTFSNHFHPEIAESAVRVLEGANFRVIFTPKQYCCGRPLYDFGFLDQAKKYLREILREMAPLIREGMPIIFLEPSCASVFRDELLNLFPHDLDALRLKQQSFMLSEFLVKRAKNYVWPEMEKAKALVQGHCHHQSVLNFDCEKEAFKKAKLDTEVMDSGCCGMAGSFGFSEKHYGVSQAAGERVMFQKIRASDPDTLILADGFSCREQILQGTGRTAFHLAQVLDPEFQRTREAQHEPSNWKEEMGHRRGIHSDVEPRAPA